MISVMTLTYKRPHLLEEAIQSFLAQGEDAYDCEMIILNDNIDSEYVIDHPSLEYPEFKIKVINHNERFSSISKKMEWGLQFCEKPWIFRLDDDDLLAPGALRHVKEHLKVAEIDIFKPKHIYFFEHNKYRGIRPGINSGITYNKAWLKTIDFKDLNFGEDRNMLYDQGGRIFDMPDPPTMIYRWGMNTTHMSGWGDIPNYLVNRRTDKNLGPEIGVVSIKPKFHGKYYEQL